MFGDDGVVACGEDVSGQRSRVGLHGIARRGQDTPLRIGQGLSAQALYKAEGNLRTGVLDSRLRDAARLHRDIDADIGVCVAIEAVDVVRAGIEANDVLGFGVGEDRLALSELILLVRLDVEPHIALGTFLAIGKDGAQHQPARVEDECLVHRLAAVDLDLFRQVGKPVGRVDKIFAGRKGRGRGGFAMGADEFETAVRLGAGVIDPPDQPGLQPRAALGDECVEADLYGHGWGCCHGRRGRDLNDAFGCVEARRTPGFQNRGFA